MTPLHLSQNQTELELCALYAFLNNALGDDIHLNRGDTNNTILYKVAHFMCFHENFASIFIELVYTTFEFLMHWNMLTNI